MEAQEYVINPNLQHLYDNYDRKVGALLEGSSRSAKTWSSVDFIIYICSVLETDCTINIIKETYNSFKTTLYDDFNRRLPMYGISSPFADRQEVKQFKLFGNKINLLGAENESVFSGNSCDYAYFNEMLDISKNVFDDTEQRCRKFWWGDYNPKFTDHWVYDKVALRKNVSFIKTTFLDNPYLSVNERNKILSYEPTHPADRELPVEERRPHPTNIAEGTADDYRWNVFGLGLRSAPEGLIFQHVKYVKEFPTKINRVYWGSDIGFTNSPTTIVKVGVDGKDIYLQCKFHNPTPRPEDYITAIDMIVGRQDYCVADSADGKQKASETSQGALGYIAECRRAGLKVYAANKFKGSIIYGLSLMKGYRIHIVDDGSAEARHFRAEQGAYRWREINGIRLDEPLDAFNHIWDAARYAVLFNLMKKK